MPPLLKRQVRFCIRTFWATVLFVVIAFAVVVQLGRLVFPYLNEYKADVESILSSQLDASVTFDAIEANWVGLRPRVSFSQVVVANKSDERIFDANHVLIELSLISLLRDWRVAVRKLSFDGLRATFVQSPDGAWTVQGLDYNQASPVTAPPTSNQNAPSIVDDPLDIFLFGRRLDLEATKLTFVFDNNVPFEVVVPNISLDNDDDFHRLSASLKSESDEEIFKLVIEAYGDPRDDENFDASAYIKTHQFPTDKVWPTVKKYWLDSNKADEPNAFSIEENPDRAAYLNLEFWSRGTFRKGLFLHGNINVDGVPFDLQGGQQMPSKISSQLVSAWSKEAGWDFNFSNLQVAWPSMSGPAMNVVLNTGPNEKPSFKIDKVDLKHWTEVAIDKGWLGGRGKDLLATLAPYGLLENTKITLLPTANEKFSLQANLKGVGVHAWRGAPGIKEVFGYVEASEKAGKVMISNDIGFEMSFPKIYHDPLIFDAAYGEVRWQIDLEQKWVGISSGQIDLNNADYRGKGHFNLRIPLDKEGWQEQQLTIMVGVKNAPTDIHKMLVPFTIPEKLYAWIENSVQGGQLHEGGFIYHGTVKPKSKLARVVQLHSDVAEASLKFDPAWPAMRNASAKFYLDDSSVRARDLRATLQGNDITQGTVWVPPLRGNDKPRISIKGQVAGSSQKALDLLSASPVKDVLGENVLNWRLDGRYQASVDLLVPLAKKGAIKPKQSLDIALTDNDLDMTDLNLKIDSISGRLYYDSDKGIRTDVLQAQFIGEPLKAKLTTQTPASGQQLELYFETNLDIRHIENWLDAPRLIGVNGKSPVQGDILIPYDKAMPIQVSGQSNLVGLRSFIPSPLSKERGEPWTTKADFSIYRGASAQSNTYNIQLAGELDIRLSTNSGGLNAISVGVAEEAQTLEEDQFNLTGVVDYLDLTSWSDYVASWRPVKIKDESVNGESTSVSPVQVETPASYVGGAWLSNFAVSAGLSLRTLAWRDFLVDHVSLVGDNFDDQWHLTVESDKVKGTYTHKPEGELPELVFEKLYLPKQEEAEEQNIDGDELSSIELEKTQAPEPDDAFHPKRFPAMLFRVHDLQIDDKKVGFVSFTSRPMAEGVSLADIEANLYGLQVGGEGNKPGELIWLKGEQGSKSYVNAQVVTDNIGDVLVQWGQEKALTSKAARFDLALEWLGNPQSLKMEKLSGDITLRLDRGRFIRGASAAENPLLKLIGLLNFDTIARRLRLDFSDLNPQGMAYEKVEGTLRFQAGSIDIDQPLVVETPSSNIEFSGLIDLEKQELDAQVVAILPVTGNLTMAAAVTGGLPAAVGVFLAGKIFKNQVDRVASLNYQVSGPWGDPKVSLQKATEVKVPPDSQVDQVEQTNPVEGSEEAPTATDSESQSDNPKSNKVPAETSTQQKVDSGAATQVQSDAEELTE